VVTLIASCFLPTWRRQRRHWMKLNRRRFIAACASAGVAKTVPNLVLTGKARRVLTLVYDQRLGMMRAIDRLVP